MAKYGVTHSCGHDETVTLFGPHKERDSKLQWLASLPCPNCLSIDRIDQAAVVHEIQQAAGLPRLVGSDKQVAWAVQIRQDFLAGWKKIDRRLTEAVVTDSPAAKLAEELLFEGDAFIAPPLTHADAKYWIDNRDSLSESAINSHLYKIRHEIADQANAFVSDDLPITDADKREVIRLALDARHQALEERRQAAAQQRDDAAVRAANEAREKQEKLWTGKDRLAQAIHAVIGKREATLSIYWKGTEKRIYIDVGYGRAAEKTCLFVTGNHRNRPASIEGNQALREALELADHDWKTMRMTVSADGKAK